MATKPIRSVAAKIPASTVLATADDLDGTVDNTQILDCAGLLRILIVQDNTGTAGTAGIDIVEISKDGGTTWAAATDVLALASNDITGTVLAAGALNAAGVEPTTSAVFKCGPYEGQTSLRIARKTTTTTGTTWVTGSPAVYAIAIGA